jgi:hypothetical protein
VWLRELIPREVIEKCKYRQQNGNEKNTGKKNSKEEIGKINKRKSSVGSAP